MTYLDDLRQNHPLTICLTNQVVKNFTANGLLSLGASPAMSEYQADLEDFCRRLMVCWLISARLMTEAGNCTRRLWILQKNMIFLRF